MKKIAKNKKINKQTLLAKYVFRGTTLGYRGNYTSVQLPVTCTSTNPAKALAFALVLAHQGYTNVVVYIADTEKLALNAVTEESANFFEKIEDEKAWAIQPFYFYKLCDGNIFFDELRIQLASLGIKINNLVTIDNLTWALKQIQAIENSVIEQLMQNIRPSLKQ